MRKFSKCTISTEFLQSISSYVKGLHLPQKISAYVYQDYVRKIISNRGKAIVSIMCRFDIRFCYTPNSYINIRLRQVVLLLDYLRHTQLAEVCYLPSEVGGINRTETYTVGFDSFVVVITLIWCLKSKLKVITDSLIVLCWQQSSTLRWSTSKKIRSLK